jgi:thiosulfate/3-mercaptopyruvate sulfurtransferase
MASDIKGFTVSADWLQRHLNDPGIAVVDASWYLPAQKRDARAEYEAGHIPRAVFFDHDQVVDPASKLPHTLPSPELFATFAGSMGVSRDDTIVVYDGPGLFSAPRAWWMFRVMGAKNVYVLEGGIDGWTRDGRFVTDKPTKVAPSFFDVHFDRSRVASLAEMRKIVDDGARQIADARPLGRFEGTDPEPRAGVRGGHMPGARNVPAAALGRDGKLLSPDELRTLISNAGIDLSKPVVTSCGSGVTAAVITLALETLGHADNKLYDGSWTEWGGTPDTPVVTGPAKP